MPQRTDEEWQDMFWEETQPAKRFENYQPEAGFAQKVRAETLREATAYLMAWAGAEDRRRIDDIAAAI